MKAAKTWCLVSLVLVAGLSSVSCGKDEGTSGAGGRGTTLTGGSGGGGGIVGRSGNTSTDGGSPDTGSGPATKLGRACVTDNDCVDPDAEGLTCVTAKDTVLGEGAPPKGLCTKACTMPTGTDDDACAALGPDAFCFPFDSTSQGYCIEGCTFGEPGLGETKCHNRAEFACNPALLGGTDTPCVTVDDCPSGDICSQGTCAIVFPGCLPACRGDLDCGEGMYCDQSFLSGVCTPTKQVGKSLGEPCTVPADDAPEEPDGCLGFCQPDSNTGNKGHCSATCSLGNECSWNPQTEKFDGICFYASVLTADTGFLGDFGFCTPSCNCTADCNDPTLSCQLSSNGPLTADFRGAALCFSADPTVKEYNQCTGAGGEGSGGAASGGAASGGAPSAGGAGSSNGGDPSTDATGGVGGAP